MGFRGLTSFSLSYEIEIYITENKYDVLAGVVTQPCTIRRRILPSASYTYALFTSNRDGKLHTLGIFFY